MNKYKKYHHPFHPMLVHFPIAFLLGATFLHIVYVAADVEAAWTVATWLIGLGLASGFFTLVTGVMDFIRFILKLERDDTILTAIWHIAFIAIALFSYLITFAYCLNVEQQAVNPFYLLTLSVLSGATLTAGGFFGGLLVYKYGVGQPT